MVVSATVGILIPRITIIGYGSEVNGLLTSVLQFITYLSLFEAGIQSVATKSLYRPVANGDIDNINSILSAVNHSYRRIGLIYLGSLLVLSAIFPIISSSTIDYITVFIVVFFSGLGNVISFFVQGKYRILMIVEGKNYILTNITTIVSVASNAIKVILLLCGIRVSFVMIAVFIISMIQPIVISLYIKKNYVWIDLRSAPNNDALKNNTSALIHQISYLIFSNTDVVLLTIFCGLESVSVYSIYKLVLSYLMKILQIPFDSCNFAMGQVFYTNRNRFCDYLDALNVLMGAMSCAMFSIAFTLLLPFVKLYTAGADIDYLSYSLALLFIVMEALNAFRIPSSCTINIAGHFKETVGRTILEMAINIICSLAFVKIFGINGVVMGTVVALTYRDIDILIYTNKSILKRKPGKTFMIYLTNITLGVICAFIFSLIPFVIDSYMSFLITGFILVLVTIPMFLVVNGVLFKTECSVLWSFAKSAILKKH